MSLLNIRTFIVVSILCLMLVPRALAFDITLPGISLGGGITADINVTVFENPSPQCDNSLNKTTIFAVHGVNSDATVFIPLADALFNNNPLNELVCRVAALEMPGHGKSGLPQGGLLFGQMTQDNYANVVIDTLDRLAADEGIRPAAIITHSNGGIVTSLVQQKLTDQGSSIADRYGIEKVTLLAPPPTAPVVWPFQQQRRDQLIFQHDCLRQGAFAPGDPCEVLDVTGPPGEITWEDIITVDQPLVAIQYDCNPLTVPIGNPTIPFAPPAGPPQMLPALLLTCVDPPDNPLGDHIPAGFLGGPAPESLKLNLELIGVPPDQRPVTQAGIFNAPNFSVISFIDDIVVGPSSVTENFFNHLSGPSETNKFLVVTGPDANHVMFIIDPVEMLEQMAEADICLILPPSLEVPTLSEWGLLAMVGVLGISGLMFIRRRKATA